MKYIFFLPHVSDVCDPAGCLSELCIQLSIIMIGKQFVNNFMEYLYPYEMQKFPHSLL